MSGLYNTVFGQNPSSGPLLMFAGFEEAPPRFRDAWIEKDGDELRIAVYTRQGGGNRENYEEWWNTVEKMPRYLRDQDDDFDNTYATAYFRVPTPEEMVAEFSDIDPKNVNLEWAKAKYLEFIDAASEPINMSERWLEAIEAIGGVK